MASVTVSATISTDSTTVASGNLALSAIVLRDNVSASLVVDNAPTTRDAILADGTVITTWAVSFVTTPTTLKFDWTEPVSGNYARVNTTVYAQASAVGGGGPTLWAQGMI